MNHGMLKLYSIVVALLVGTILNASNVIDFDLIKKGKQNNNTLLIFGGIQGDEPGGFLAASILSTHYTIKNGSVWIVPNFNFYSILQRDRGPYGDLNRKFAYLSKKDPEYKLVQRAKSLIKEKHVKLVLNLHDGSGFYRDTYKDKSHSPYKWGQCSVIDQVKLDDVKYGNLKDISQKVINHVNDYALRKEDHYHTHNTHTRDGDKEMEKSLTYYAINQNKPAFGNEASKNLPTHKRVYYHLLAVEKYMDIMGIKYKRDFKLTPLGVYNAINKNNYISFYDGKIKLPLTKIRHNINYFPIKKGSSVDFKPSNSLITILKRGNYYHIQYGNRHLARLKADYIDYDSSNAKVKLIVDGKAKDVLFGTTLNVENNFIVRDNKNYRINVIGYTNSTSKETDIKIRKSQIIKKYSLDKNGNIYRIEYYKGKKFAGMVLVKFIN